MTKQHAIMAATKISKQKKIVMAVVNDSISNNLEQEPTGPWGYCPNDAKDEQGRFILFRWATEVIVINPA